MMLATKHHFHDIQERANIFIPLEFRNSRDTRPKWRTASFQYLDGVWEWVQVTSDHVASTYPLLATTHGAKPAQSPACHQVLTFASPTECSMAINLPSARLPHKGGATTRLKVQFKMSRLIWDHPTLLVCGTPGMSISRTNQGNSLLTKLWE